jgi:hypothetical protein
LLTTEELSKIETRKEDAEVITVKRNNEVKRIDEVDASNHDNDMSNTKAEIEDHKLQTKKKDSSDDLPASPIEKQAESTKRKHQPKLNIS